MTMVNSGLIGFQHRAYILLVGMSSRFFTLCFRIYHGLLLGVSAYLFVAMPPLHAVTINCDRDNCIYGSCEPEAPPSCICYPGYFGDRCQHYDVSGVNVSVSDDTIVLHLPQSPHLTSAMAIVYRFVFF